MKKILTVVFIFLFAFTLKVEAYENLTPKVSKDEKLFDYANLLEDSEEERIKEEINKYIENTDYDLVVVTIETNPYTGDNASINYARDFYDYNGYGKRVNRAGAIILIDMQNRKVFFDRSGHALLTYDDVRGKKIYEKIASYLKDGDYTNGILEGINLANNYYEDGIPDSNKDYCVDDAGEYYRCVKRVKYGLSAIIATVVTLIVVLIHLSRYKGIKLATNANNYMTKETKGNKSDQFLYTHTSRTRVNNSSSTGSGGGTSINRGSSGRSHSSSGGGF